MGPVSRYGGTQPSQGQGQQSYPQAPFAQQGQPFQFGQPVQPYQQPQQQKSNPIAEALGALGLLFFLRRYRPGYRPRRQSSGCCGCLVALVILGIIFGIPGYFYYRANAHVFQQFQNQINSQTGNTPSTLQNTTATAVPTITTTRIGQMVNYAGDSITVVDVKQSSAFPDDSDTSANGLVRLDLMESTGEQVSGFLYSDVTRLMLPNGTSVAPTNEQNGINPQASTSRNNWLDFPVPTSIKPNQLTLVLGTNQQAQIKMPLTGSADLTAYQPKTATLNTPINYWGMNWTLVSATRTISANGKQADAGMRFVVLTFKVDNPTSNNIAIGFPNDYMRLKSGNITNSPSDKTLPLYANANTTGTTGTVTFPMPEGASAYTLNLLTTQGGASTPASTNFQI